MNQLDDKQLDQTAFSYRDLLSLDRWETWTVAFGSLTVVGATSYSGRYRVIGRSVQFQVSFSAATSIASVAGTDYLTLPIASKGLTGFAYMTNATTNIAVGECHVDATNSRCYLPTQGASSNTFNIVGWYEI